MSGVRAVRLLAYAKLNLTLEVLGRRADGYHELRTVLQTISLADELTVTLLLQSKRAAKRRPFRQTMHDDDLREPPPFADNLALQARDKFLAVQQSSLPASWEIALDKRVAVAAGLGGGSSDAAAVLRAMNELCVDPLATAELEDIAAMLGSDAPFFVRGGTQLAEGRGELLQALPDLPETWFVLVPRVADGERKTARLFSLLRPEDFADGSRGAALVQALRDGAPLDQRLLFNTFERVEEQAFPGLEPVRRAVERVCGHAVLSGAGPSLFALAPDEESAHGWVRMLAPDVRAVAVRSVSAAEAGATTLFDAPSA